MQEESIQTVTGEIPISQLGKTLVHEHFLFGYPGYTGDQTLGKFNRDSAIQVGIKMANHVRKYGVKTVIDPTPNECGRNPEVLKEISKASGVQIVCATGYYYEGEGATPYFKFRQSLGTAEEDIYDMFLSEISSGIEETGIKPGIIKLASSKGRITEYESMFFKAAAKAHRKTGIRILTHTQEGTMGLEQAKLLIHLGVDPSKIIIGHMCGNTDIEYQKSVLHLGVKIGFDRFGIQGLVGTPMDTERLETLIQLVTEGYGNQIMLSQDFINYWLGRPPTLNGPIATLLKNWSPTHLFENIIPKLLDEGIRMDDVEQMFLL